MKRPVRSAPIAAQAHCQSEKNGGNQQAGPQPGADQKLTHTQLAERNHGHMALGKTSTLPTTAKTISQHGGEMRSVEGNLLDHGDRDGR